jgi:endonuclease/exonuclease/phosphatase family metal-dependent hydrolase
MFEEHLRPGTYGLYGRDCLRNAKQQLRMDSGECKAGAACAISGGLLLLVGTYLPTQCRSSRTMRLKHWPCRIDHLLLSLALAERLVGAGVDRAVRGWQKASDHAPTWIEIANNASSDKSKSPEP